MAKRFNEVDFKRCSILRRQKHCKTKKILIDAFTTFSTGLFCFKMVGTLSYTGDAGTRDLLRSRCGVLIVRSVLKGTT